MKVISIVFGTRPEAIKLAPVILSAQKIANIQSKVCVTAQHRQMLDQALEVFGITPDADLDLMKANQTLAELTSNAIRSLDQYFSELRPDLVIVQGDTTTAFCAALGAFYQQIPVAHVEAGLRTWNLMAPWPEEANRILISRLATLHFAPTNTARSNLLQEGIPSERVFVTGNTVVDAVHLVRKKISVSLPEVPSLPSFLQPKTVDGPKLVLITGHRRENFGQSFENICTAIAILAEQFPDVHFVYPVHLNPNVQEPVHRILGHIKEHRLKDETTIGIGTDSNIHLIEPVPYPVFVALMNRSSFILTDSGGVQEESLSMGVPVLVMRESTERPEAIAVKGAELVGTDISRIVQYASQLLEDPSIHMKMTEAENPYGDGHAAEKIIDICKAFLDGSLDFITGHDSK